MKKIVLGLFLICIVILTGCKAQSNTGTTLDNPFIGGTEGILIDFVEDSPPEEVRAGGDVPFDVVVKLKNDGEHKVLKEMVTVTLSGINAQEFDKQEQDLISNALEDLEPRKKEDGEVVESSPIHVEFYELNRLEDFSGGTYTIRADVCYEYATEAISQICIKSNNL